MSHVAGAILAQFLTSKIAPFGLNTIFSCVESQEGVDHDTYELSMAGTGHSQELSYRQLLNIPKISTTGGFVLRGLDYNLTREAIQDYATLDANYVVRERADVLARIIEDTLIKSCTDWYYRNTTLNGSAVQSSVDSAISSNSLCQLVDIDNPSLMSQVSDSVYLVNDAKAFDVEAQEFPTSMMGKLDPATTSASNTINQVFRLVNGVTTKDGEFVEGSGMFSKCIEDSGIGLSLTPKRMNLLSAQYSQAMPLAKPEAPTVTGPNNKLDGAELITAVMDCNADTYEDAFMVSKSAAKRLTSVRHYRCRFLTDGDLTIHVKVGDKVSSKDELATSVDLRLDEEKTHRIKKIYNLAEVVSITTSTADMFGKPFDRIDIVVREEQVLRTGDKITTRGGIKGVAVVREDAEMPSDDTGLPVDVVVSPKSLYNRQSASTWWEMMMNLKGESFTSIPDMDTPFKSLVAEGYGDKVQCFYAGTALPEKTFVAPLFIFRLNKMAHETLAFADKCQVLDENNIPMDNSVNGQRRDLGYSLAIAAKGLDGMFRDMTTTNVPSYIHRVAAAIGGEVLIAEPTINYELMTCKDLRALCKSKGLVRYSALRKKQLIEMLSETVTE